jgi:SanA protein
MRFVVYFITVFLSLLILNHLYISYYSRDFIYDDISRVPSKKVALILGTTKYIKKGKINYFYRYRIEAGAKLFLNGKVKALLVSGDNSSKYYNEPVKMKRDLIKLGVPAKYIALDYAGFRTLDSIIRADKIFGIDDYIVVSQPFHLKRAIFIAKKKGYKVVGFSAKQKSRTLSQYRMYLREILARAKAFLDIYLLNTKSKFLGNREKIIYKD